MDQWRAGGANYRLTPVATIHAASSDLSLGQQDRRRIRGMNGCASPDPSILKIRLLSPHQVPATKGRYYGTASLCPRVTPSPRHPFITRPPTSTFTGECPRRYSSMTSRSTVGTWYVISSWATVTKPAKSYSS